MIKINNIEYKVKRKDDFRLGSKRYLYLIIKANIEDFRKYDGKMVTIILYGQEFTGELETPHECLDNETVMFRVVG